MNITVDANLNTVYEISNSIPNISITCYNYVKNDYDISYLYWTGYL